MKFYMCTDYDFDKAFFAESPEKLMEIIVKYHVEETDTLLMKELDEESQIIRLEWKDKFSADDDFYEEGYDYTSVTMNSHKYLR